MSHLALPFLPTAPVHKVSSDRPALIDDANLDWLSYGKLRANIAEVLPIFRHSIRQLIFCCVPQSIEGVTVYLAAAASGHAIAMIDAGMPHFDALVSAYRPAWIILPQEYAPNGYTAVEGPFQTLRTYRGRNENAGEIHPDLYLLLLTSGSTGSSKGVRLSYKNLASNTEAIIASLALTADICALAHLPLSYSFGLSVLHSQLAVGGSCVLTTHGMMSREFWQAARAHKTTLFPGVPYHYEMVAKLGFERINMPSLKMFLQAGGKMREQLTEDLWRQIEARHGKFFIMYGQTEASPRISCLPLHEYPEKLGTCGRALSGGALAVEDDEIIYKGPNVMMGYAESRSDLALGDIMLGRLITGDQGSIDQDGFLTIHGRKQRFAKLFGQRVSLDDLEKIAGVYAHVVAIEFDDKVVLVLESKDAALQDRIKSSIISETKLPPTWLDIRSVETIPYRGGGKIDYSRLREIM